MSKQTTSDDPRRQRLEEVIGAFLVAVDAGQKPDPNEWLARHGDLCPELAEFFADLGRMDKLVEPVKLAPSQPLAEPTMSVDSTEEGAPRTAAESGVAATRADIDGADTGNGESGFAALVKGTRVRYFGDYELEKVLGEGGMGIVYKARQRSLNRSVALKMIKATRFPSSDEVRRFQNEAEAVARLDHPNIVPIYEVNQFEDQHYFAMKLIAGESLDKRLKDYMTDPKRAAHLVATTAAAIHHAHQRGILHRDLKPANILVDPQGQPHVTDFGLAKRVEGDSELTRSGAVLGTPAYMAPEQASAKKGAVTTATDVYGLGAILYTLLTGRAPFGGTTVLDTLEQVRERQPESPRKLNPRVPRDLEVICLKCLEKEPGRRYMTADALAEDLKRWLAGMPIAARPVGKAARFRMWCRRNPILAGAAGLVASALVGVSVISLLYAQQQTRLATALRLYGDEQKQRASEQSVATRKITAQASELEKQGQNLKTSLADTNRRLAMFNFERAERAFDGGQVSHGLLYLIECWRYAERANDAAWQHLARANLTFWRHQCPELRGKFSQRAVSQGSFSPDGKTIVIPVGDKTARLWSIPDERPIGRAMVHADPLQSAIFSPDGKTVLTVGDKTARLWHVPDCEPVGKPVLQQGKRVRAAMSPDGRTVLTWDQGSVEGSMRLWNATTGQPIGRAMVHRAQVHFATFSPDGKTVLSSASDAITARLWDATTGSPIGGTLPELTLSVPAFSPNSKLILTSLFDRACLWDTSTGSAVHSPMVHEDISSAVFSPDGKTILTTSDDMSSRLWDTRTGLPWGPKVQHDSPDITRHRTKGSFSPDGKTFLIRSGLFNKVYLGDAASGSPIGKPLEHRAAVHAATFSPDSKMVLTGSEDGTVRLWDVATGELINSPIAHPSQILSVAFSPDGTSFLARTEQNDGAWLWGIRPGLPVGQCLLGEGEPFSVTFSPDGTKLLILFYPEGGQLCDARTGSPLGIPINGADGHGLTTGTFSPDGKTLLTGDLGGFLRLWDAGTGETLSQPIRVFNPNPADGSGRRFKFVSAVAYHPAGTMFLAVSDDGTLGLWDATSLHQISHQTNTNCAAFGPDGRFVAIGSRDKTLRLWDTSTRGWYGTPMKHDGEVVCVAFHPDGSMIATGSQKGIARVWDTNSCQSIGPPLIREEPIETIAFSGDGRNLVAGTQKKTFLQMTQVGKVLEPVNVWNVAGVNVFAHPVTGIRDASDRAFSLDRKTLLTSSKNGLCLRDIATGQPIGPELRFGGPINQGAFSPDGKAVVGAYFNALVRGKGSVRLFRLPGIVDDSLDRASVWVEAVTGLELNAEDAIRTLDAERWMERHEQLRQIGGVAKTEAGWLSDPVLYGPDPCARARVWEERKRWTEAEAEFTEVLLARPHLSFGWLERGLFYAKRSEPEKAMADFVRSLTLGNRDEKLISEIVRSRETLDRALALLPNEAGALSTGLQFCRARHLCNEARIEEARAVLDRAGSMTLEEARRWGIRFGLGSMLGVLGFSRRVSALRDRYQHTTNTYWANDIAFSCVLAGTAVCDPDATVKLAEFGVKGLNGPGQNRDRCILGGALYRAGRFADAVQQLEEGIRLRDGSSGPEDWAFLAMAHHRLGHHAEATRWLDRLRSSSQQRDAWSGIVIQRLRSEAEAVILYDPVFPDDPFCG